MSHGARAGRWRSHGSCRPAIVKLALVVALLVGLISAGAPATNAEPRLSAVTRPEPGIERIGASLSAVACPSNASCFAVGGTDPQGASGKTLVERWNGSTWGIMNSPNPIGATGSTSLRGVSCPSANSCFAVGDYEGPLGEATLAERWQKGSAWAIMNGPAGTTPAYLDKVSCPNTKLCFAVGATGATDANLVERWANGHPWSIVSGPTPSAFAGLTGLSCPSTTNCTAVGSSYVSTDVLTFSMWGEHWNGTSWSKSALPDPTGTSFVLNQVSCPSTTNCTAVGAYAPTFADLTLSEQLVEHWNGTRWSIVVPNPSYFPSSGLPLSGVSCPNTTYCIAVGAEHEELAEHGNGATWSIVTQPDTQGDSLNDVKCRTTTNCTAVGNYNGSSGEQALVEHWNGTSWSIVASPTPTATSLRAP